jgi:hypothetical protein
VAVLEQAAGLAQLFDLELAGDPELAGVLEQAAGPAQLFDLELAGVLEQAVNQVLAVPNLAALRASVT